MSEQAAVPEVATPPQAGSEAPAANDFNTITMEEPEAPPAEPVVETPAEPPAEVPAEQPQDVAINTLANGTKEVRLSTGEVFRGKDDAEVIQNIALGKIEATRTIQSLRQPVTPTLKPGDPAPEINQPILADLLAQEFGLKSGAELIQAFQQQNQIAQQQQQNNTAVQFLQQVPDFPRRPENTDKLGQFLDDRSLPFTVENAMMAHYYLLGKGEYVPVVETPRTPTGQFAPRQNMMPMPPNGASAPAGTFSEADILAMSPAEYQKTFG